MADGSLHETVMEQGRVFAAVFYLSVLMFVLSHGTGVVSLLFSSSPFFVIDLGLLILVGVLLRRHNLYLTLYLTFVFPLIAILFLTVAMLPLITSLMPVYIASFAVAMLFGVLTAYMFRQTSDSDLKFLAPGLIVSAAIALAAGMIAVMSQLFQQLAQTYAASRGPLATMVAVRGITPHGMFLLLFLSFNLTFLYYCWEERRNYRLLTLYVIPVLLYAVMAFSSSQLLSVLMDQLI